MLFGKPPAAPVEPVEAPPRLAVECVEFPAISLKQAGEIADAGGLLTFEQVVSLLWTYGPNARDLFAEALFEARHKRDPNRWPRPLTAEQRAMQERDQQQREEDARFAARFAERQAQEDLRPQAPYIVKAKPRIVIEAFGEGTITRFEPDEVTVRDAQCRGEHVETVTARRDRYIPSDD